MYIIFKVMVYLRKKYGSNNYKKKKQLALAVSTTFHIMILLVGL